MSYNHIAHPVEAIQVPGQDGYSIGTNLESFVSWLVRHASDGPGGGSPSVSWSYDSNKEHGSIHFEGKARSFDAAWWIVKHSRKDFRIVSPEDFRKNYERTQGEDR